MLMKLGAFLAAVAVASPQPLEDVNLQAYLGRWYQTHASLTVKYTFELGGNCVTADYGTPDGFTPSDGENPVITVTNEGRPKYSRWIPRWIKNFFKIEGFAAQSLDFDGALSVQFFGGSDPTEVEFESPGNYWIVALSELTGEQYKWAVVTNASQTQLYILVRDVEDFRANDQEYVLGLVEEMGFTKFYNKPRTTNQDGCPY